MARRKIQSVTQSEATPDQLWAFVRDFCSAWHPAIESMVKEPFSNGGLIRRFTVQGDASTYRERLTWFSDSDRTLAYTHVAGIAGVHQYDARMVVAPTSTGATVTMSAEFSAPAERADAIAQGTQDIFDDGTKIIAKSSHVASMPPTLGPIGAAPQIELKELAIDDLPRLALTVSGAESDTLCLFLHGIGGQRSNWDAQLKALAPYCRVAALDLRGYGDSSLGPDQSTVDDYCDDILRVADVLNAKRLVLCGLSYGAWIATSFAMRHPEKLRGVVLSGGCTGMSEAGADERDAFRLSREVPMGEGKTPADFAPAVVNAIVGPHAPENVRAGLLASMQAISTETYSDALRCFTNPLEKFDFSKMNLPVLLMTGEYDKLAPSTEIKRVAERIWDAAHAPDVRFEVIENAGHVCNVEQPATYNRILVEFVQRLEP